MESFRKAGRKAEKTGQFRCDALAQNAVRLLPVQLLLRSLPVSVVVGFVLFVVANLVVIRVFSENRKPHIKPDMLSTVLMLLSNIPFTDCEINIRYLRNDEVTCKRHFLFSQRHDTSETW